MNAAPVDDGFSALLEVVRRDRGFVYERYKESCLRRRVRARMRSRGVESYQAYQDLIARDERELDKLTDSLTINVTRFFRNQRVWEAVRERVVAPLWASELPEIRVWSAGCAGGDEAYTMAMLFHRHAAVNGMLAQIGRVSVRGTDVDAPILAAAAAGAYPESSLTEVPEDFRTRYFGEAPHAVAPGVRRMVQFARHDLLTDAFPTAAEHVIICRNVLIYFDRPTQEEVLARFRDSLVPGGFLILGRVESLLGASRAGFEPVAQRERIYRRTN